MNPNQNPIQYRPDPVNPAQRQLEAAARIVARLGAQARLLHVLMGLYDMPNMPAAPAVDLQAQQLEDYIANARALLAAAGHPQQPQQPQGGRRRSTRRKANRRRRSTRRSHRSK
jgi:isopentenyl diphosphate isomerase/L-lactate dehydrogenase-like FMN-dependent dehydrogenase